MGSVFPANAAPGGKPWEAAMVVNWQEMLGEAVKALGALAKGNPAIMDGYKAIDASGSALGALDAKTRELISLAVAATTRCDTCIAVHAQAASEAGASRAELLEALGVAISLNSGAALVYSSRILEAFDALAKK